MWVPSAVGGVFSNANRDAQAAVDATFVAREEKDERPEVVAPPSSVGTGKMAAVSNRDSSYHRGEGVDQSAAGKHVEKAVTALAEDISKVEVQIVSVEREIDEAQEAVATGEEHRGRSKDALIKEVERLALKEGQLRDREKLLREEKLILFGQPSPMSRAVSAGGTSTTPKRVSFVETHAHPNGSEQESMERKRLTIVHKLIRQRSLSSSVHTNGDLAGTDTVVNFHKAEEDNRLLAKLGSFQAPIVVSTLLAGFTLVLFDVSTTELSKQLALLSFAFEITASTVLSLIVYHGQSLYSYSTDIETLTRDFIRRMAPVIVFALVAFALGVGTYVAAFVVEASEGLGKPWMAVMLVLFFPTIAAAALFTYSTVVIRGRYSFNRKVPSAMGLE